MLKLPQKKIFFRYAMLFSWGLIALCLYVGRLYHQHASTITQNNKGYTPHQPLIQELQTIDDYLTEQPTNAMLFLRKAQIHSSLQEYQLASEALRTFAELEPNLLLSQHLRM